MFRYTRTPTTDNLVGPSSYSRLLQILIYGVVNAILTIPVNYGFAGIIFGDPIFTPYLPTLSKLVLWSSIVHQVRQAKPDPVTLIGMMADDMAKDMLLPYQLASLFHWTSARCWINLSVPHGKQYIKRLATKIDLCLRRSSRSNDCCNDRRSNCFLGSSSNISWQIPSGVASFLLTDACRSGISRIYRWEVLYLTVWDVYLMRYARRSILFPSWIGAIFWEAYRDYLGPQSTSRSA